MKMKTFTEEERDMLSKKDFAAIEKGILAYENLLHKRES